MIRRLLVASAVALTAGATAILGLSAALDATWDPEAAVLVALAAVWLPMTLLTTLLITRSRT
ncbi:hypothetical protein [Micromonospora echinospora]|uniref:hypothetical protein n=1 Tax=Micromonospora echinospora TaxID=1877 RepID=UPI003A85FB24